MMKCIGAVLLLCGCCGFGFSLAAAEKREQTMLRRLMGALQEMEWELKFRMTALPDLCRIAGSAAGGTIKQVFSELANKLDAGEVTQISGSLNGILNGVDLPRRVKRSLRQLGRSLGQFDLEGQLQGIQTVRMQCRKDLEILERDSIQRLHGYRTLAFCAGAVLVILFI